jgi:glycosyltransferase involved in cell wall biosynthesis
MPDKVTIITVTRNDVENLRNTIDSVLAQTYENREYIVIDGGSTDGTCELLRGYDHGIDVWLSEPDEGIFHAMNKGAERATGDWVLFLNSGDLFFNNRVLSDCFSETIPANIDAVYGNTVYSYGKEGYREFRKAGELCHFWKGLMTCHQSFFVRRKVLERRKFDLRYKVAADFCSLYGLYMNGGLFLHIPVYVSLVDTTGISNNEKMVRSVREHWRVINQYHGNKLYYQVYYLLRFLWTVALWGAKRIIPGIIYIQVIRLLRCEKDRKGPMDDFR